jgi:hypothetical protein
MAARMRWATSGQTRSTWAGSMQMQWMGSGAESLAPLASRAFTPVGDGLWRELG